MDAVQQAEWERSWRHALQPRLDEPILACGLFYRTGRRRGPGLPGRFLIAVTPTRVHAFEAAVGGGGVEAREEVAVWDRGGLIVTAEEKGAGTRVVFEARPGGERVVCSTARDAVSRSVIRALQAPAGASALA